MKKILHNYIKIWFVLDVLLLIVLFFIDDKALQSLSFFNDLPISKFAMQHSAFPGFSKNYIGIQFVIGLVYIILGPVYRVEYFKRKKQTSVVYGVTFVLLIFGFMSLAAFFGISFLITDFNDEVFYRNLVGYALFHSLDNHLYLSSAYFLFYAVMSLGFNLSIYLLRIR